MKYETKRIIIKVVAGAAAAAALGTGIAFGVPAISNYNKHMNTSVTYNDANYKLGELYLLTNQNGESTMCYLEVISSKLATKFVTGFSIGNGFMYDTSGNLGYIIGNQSQSGDIVMGTTVRSKKTYGYKTLDSGELIAIEGLEEEFGYKTQPLTNLISFEVAKDKGFIVTEEDLDNYLPSSGKSK